MVIDAVEVRSFVLRQRVIVPPGNGRVRTEHEAITSFLTEDPAVIPELMLAYWAGDVDERIVEALPEGDVYATPGLEIKTISFTGPDGSNASALLSDEHKRVLGLA